MSFENIIGNQKVKDMLNRAVNSNSILHSYLFLGIDGIGKNLFAHEFAKIIMCQEDKKPCGKCKSCVEFENHNHPDFMLIENEEKVIKIEQIRYMNQKISEKPIISNRKVYIINNSGTMTKEAQNCLLKTLEEPPEYATIILVCSNENKLLNTIRSRCTKLNFNKIEDEEILNYIKENTEEDLNFNFISYCEGSLGKLLKIKENKDSYIKTEQVINSMNSNDLVYILNNSEILYKSKDIIYDLLEYINMLLLKSRNINKINCIKYVEEAKRRLITNSNYDMTIDNLLMKMWEEMNV